MAEKPKPSRAPTARPRKLAGRGSTPEPARAEEAVEPEVKEPEGQAPEGEEPEPDWPDERIEVHRGSLRETVVLSVLIVLLVAVAGREAWYLWGKEEPVVSASRPVVVSPLTASSVVDTAAKAATEFISGSYENYDEHVDDVTKMMTDGMAKQYRQTKEDVREEFIASKTKVSADVAEQGVVSASPEQVVALLFLTQTTERPEEPLEVVQYKVEVTMVHTASGWLVSKVDTL